MPHSDESISSRKSRTSRDTDGLAFHLRSDSWFERPAGHQLHVAPGELLAKMERSRRRPEQLQAVRECVPVGEEDAVRQFGESFPSGLVLR